MTWKLFSVEWERQTKKKKKQGDDEQQLKQITNVNLFKRGNKYFKGENKKRIDLTKL